MNDYDFRSLNDKEFEILSRDLLQKELNITLESFKTGKDGGVDLRYCDNGKEHGEIIVQAKHWSKSGIKKLISHLKKSELKKVKTLNPKRYIITTSVELSPFDKKEIKDLFSPYIVSEADVLGKEDLNNLLGKFKDIEEKHYKLWLSSTNILRKIVNNGIQGRSEFIADNIVKNIKLYVSNDSHIKALEILNRERFLVIVGEPGIGKTSLAKMLVYQLLSTDYELIVINDSKEAESLWQPGKKQVFYFDDFLGSNRLELMSGKNEDSNLVSFIKRMKADPKKRLILTSRTTILNQAENKFSKLKDPLIDLSKHEVKVRDYGKLNKALILYNHLYFNELPEEFYEKITDDKNYFKIINHKNFNPRIIEFITDPNRLAGLSSEDYLEFILKNLSNPSLIWENPYEQQIDDYSRFLLTTLFSLDKPNDLILQKAFESRLDYEITNGNFQRVNSAFSNSLRDLLDGFIIATRSESSLNYNFFNPSISDFLIDYLNKNPSEKWRVLESVVFAEQFVFRFKKNSSSVNSINFSNDELSRLHQLLRKKETILETFESGSKEFSLLNLYLAFFDIDSIEEDLQRILPEINLYELSPKQSKELSYLMEVLFSYEWARNIFSGKWNEIVECLFRNATSESDFESIIKFFELYDEDYSEYLKEFKNKSFVISCVERYWNTRINDIQWSNEEVGSYFEEEEVDDYLSNLYSDGISFNKKLGITTDVLDKIRFIDAAEIAETNSDNAMAEDHVADMQKEDWKIQIHEEREINDRIADMFDFTGKTS